MAASSRSCNGMVVSATLVCILQSLVWVALGVVGMMHYSCTIDTGEKNPAYLLTLTYFMNTDCRATQQIYGFDWTLDATPARSQRTHDILLWFIVSGSVRAVAAAALMLAGCLGSRASSGSGVLFWLWVLVDAAGLAGDAVCGIFYLTDLGLTGSVADLLGGVGLDGLLPAQVGWALVIPSWLMGLACFRFVIFWLLDIILVLIATVGACTQRKSVPEPKKSKSRPEKEKDRKLVYTGAAAGGGVHGSLSRAPGADVVRPHAGSLVSNTGAGGNGNYYNPTPEGSASGVFYNNTPGGSGNSPFYTPASGGGPAYYNPPPNSGGYYEPPPGGSSAYYEPPPGGSNTYYNPPPGGSSGYYDPPPADGSKTNTWYGGGQSAAPAEPQPPPQQERDWSAQGAYPKQAQAQEQRLEAPSPDRFGESDPRSPLPKTDEKDAFDIPPAHSSFKPQRRYTEQLKDHEADRKERKRQKREMEQREAMAEAAARADERKRNAPAVPPKPKAPSEFNKHIPFSYVLPPLDDVDVKQRRPSPAAAPAARAGTSGSAAKDDDEDAPPVPVPDYTLHFKRSNDRPGIDTR